MHYANSTMKNSSWNTHPQLYNLHAKLSKIDLYAPIGHVGHLSSPLLKILIDLKVPEIMYALIGSREFLPNSLFFRVFARDLCERVPAMCENLLFLLTGFDPSKNHNFNATRFGVMVHNSPGGTSTKNLMHWVQNIKSDHFDAYDYGGMRNLLPSYYDQWSAPEYDVRGICGCADGCDRKGKNSGTNPHNRHDKPHLCEHLDIALYGGSRDVLADPTDVETLVGTLMEAGLKLSDSENNHGGNGKFSVRRIENYEHLDFTWGMSAHKLVYAKTMARFVHQSGMTAPTVIKTMTTSSSSASAAASSSDLRSADAESYGVVYA